MPFIAYLAPESQVCDTFSIYTVPSGRREKDLYCVDCDKRLRFHRKRTSDSFSEHFKHISEEDNTKCPGKYGMRQRSDPDSWHKAMTSYVDPGKREVLRKHPYHDGTKHIVDAFDQTSQCGFEFQNSDIDATDVRSREETTPDLHWIFNTDRCTIYHLNDPVHASYAFIVVPPSWQRCIPTCTYPVWFSDRYCARVYQCISNEVVDAQIRGSEAAVSGCIVRRFETHDLWEMGRFRNVCISRPLTSSGELTEDIAVRNSANVWSISLNEVHVLSSSFSWDQVIQQHAQETHSKCSWYASMCKLLESRRDDWCIWSAQHVQQKAIPPSQCWLFNSNFCSVHYSDIGQFYVVEPHFLTWIEHWEAPNVRNNLIYVWGANVPLLCIQHKARCEFRTSDEEGDSSRSKTKVIGFLAYRDDKIAQEILHTDSTANATDTERVIENRELFPCSPEAQQLLDQVIRNDICERHVPLLQRNEKMAVAAPAGGGKTTLLLQAAKKLYPKKILYITFNKELQCKVGEKCSQNVYTRTFDSISREALIDHAAYFRNRPDQAHRVEREPFSTDLHQGFREQFPEYAESIKRSKWYNPYIGSQDTAVNVVIQRFKHFCADLHVRHPKDSEEYDYDILKRMWKKTTNYEWITFDGMRKLLHTTEALRSLVERTYDYVFVDEVQDLNPIMLDILDQQLSLPCLFVGDQYQSIYGFHGSENLFASERWRERASHDDIKRRLRVDLFQTYRFGNPLCRRLLDWFGGLQIAPNQDRETALIQDPEPTRTGDHLSTFLATTDHGTYVYLFRFWDTLINHVLQNRVHVHNKGNFDIPGIKKKLGEWERLIRSSCSRQNEDLDIMRMPDSLKGLSVEEFNSTKEELLASLRSNSRIQYSTIHQWKGKESHTARVAGDIQVSREKSPDDDAVPRGDEQCLFYVALTRAHARVILDEQK